MAIRGKGLDWIERHYRKLYPEGVGELHRYVPWLKVRDVPSRGVSSQFSGRKTGRLHTAFSDLERDAMLAAQWLDTVTDMREQFPLWPLQETLEIAEELAVAHPAATGEPILMTTDILLTTVTRGTRSFEPVTVKPEADLADRRVLEKFEIERVYWERRGYKLGIVTRRDLPKDLTENLAWINKFHEIDGDSMTPVAVARAERLLVEMLSREAAVPLNELCARADDRLGHETGTCLGVVRHAISKKRWMVPLANRIDPRQPLPRFERGAVTRCRTTEQAA